MASSPYSPGIACILQGILSIPIYAYLAWARHNQEAWKAERDMDIERPEMGGNRGKCWESTCFSTVN